MEISPFFFFLTPIQHFCIFTTKKKRMEKSPFSKKNKRFHLEKHVEKRFFFPILSFKTLLKKKEWRFLHSFKKEWRFLHSFEKEWRFLRSFEKEWRFLHSLKKEWRFLHSFEKEWKFLLLFSDPLQQYFYGFSLYQKKKGKKRRKLQSQKKRFHLQHADFLFLSVKTFFTTK